MLNLSSTTRKHLEVVFFLLYWKYYYLKTGLRVLVGFEVGRDYLI